MINSIVALIFKSISKSIHVNTCSLCIQKDERIVYSFRERDIDTWDGYSCSFSIKKID